MVDLAQQEKNKKYIKSQPKFIIMCGGEYSFFKKHKALSRINGEVIVEHTIKLLKKHGIKNIVISSNNPAFDEFGVPRCTNAKNNYEAPNDKIGFKGVGYWLDAFYPCYTKCIYLYGDVWYTDNAIDIIINTYKQNKNDNILFGSAISANKLQKNWGEPYAYLVNKPRVFQRGIAEVKKLQDEGKLLRPAITWELYRYLNNLDVNVQQVKEDTFVIIDDDEMFDIDSEQEIENK